MNAELKLDLHYIIGEALNTPSKPLLSKLLELERQVKGGAVERGLCEFGRKLMGVKTRDISSFSPVDLQEEVEYALLLLCLEQYDQAIKLGERQLASDSHFGMRQSEPGFDPKEFRSFQSVLFKALKKLTGNACFESRESFQLSPYLARLEAYLLATLPTLYQNVHVNQTGIASFECGRLKGQFSLEGVHGGFGSVDAQSASIVTMGPHFFPLGVSDLYGIYRTKGSVEDVQISNDPFAFKGWTRLAHKQKPSDLWMEVVASTDKDKLKLSVKFLNFTDFSPISIAFFVRANKVVVNPFFEVYPSTLERYQGGCETISLSDGALTLKAQFEGEMQVIPLAGGPYFWGADFLVAYAIHEEMTSYDFDVL
ncbi:MAG: hypothetical protein SP1CHLAM54_09820 [Chlamydiia bacterium]|nr:hypothetical protein [Chlamydiia bacterium]MCH9615888.1 hypothetical protein [Chlamydiia bacterium]MCH9628709.1 hypothetical protein [Chlamydiia bacterium]